MSDSTQKNDEQIIALKRMLFRQYSGVFGTKVFWLAIFTLLPLLLMLKIEALKLNVHIPTLVYAVYHILGIYVFALVRRMRTEPENFSDKELIEELNYARRIDKIVRPLGIVVVVLLIATLFAKLEVAVGDESHRVVSFPLFVYKVLGVPIPPPPPPIIVEPPPPPHVFPPQAIIQIHPANHLNLRNHL